MSYTSFIENIIKDYEYGVPIYVKFLAKNVTDEFKLNIDAASSAVSVSLNRILNGENKLNLRFYKKGIYYRAKITSFGETHINKEMLIENKYLSEDNGYETGLSLLHHMGLTTQIPKERIFATNKSSKCIRKDKTLGIYICPSKVRINALNKSYLQLLDAIDMLYKAPIDVDNPYLILSNYIKKMKLDYGELLSIAGEYYSKNTVLLLARIARERK